MPPPDLIPRLLSLKELPKRSSLYHSPVAHARREPLLLLVNLFSKGEAFPIQVLKEVDSALATAGFKKEVHSVVVPGREFSVTYDGPSMDKNRIEEILKPLAEENQIGFSVEVEESVRFP
jgi:hypothetical protein